jgi:iron complex transport system permease protein
VALRRLPRTRGAWLVALVLLVGVAAALSLAVGAKSIPLDRVVDALVHPDRAVDDHSIVRQLRVPRTLLALAVGGALGLAGAVMQGVTRNPLADPGLLGVNAGAALAVVAATFAFGASTVASQVWFAFAGAAVAGLLVSVLGSVGRSGATPVKLAIAGAAMAALMSSCTSAMLLLDSASLDRYRFWAVGAVAGRDLAVVKGVLPFLAVGTLLAFGVARSLNGLALGDDVARSLGQRVGWARAASAIAVVLLCGGATAAAGPIWFVGLTVPHLARALSGPDHRCLLPSSLLIGAILLTTADVLGRILVRPGELEVGIVTAFVGAPVFIAFVRRRRIAEL